MSQCPCSQHECSNMDEYVEQGVHCEECFRNHVEVGE